MFSHMIGFWNKRIFILINKFCIGSFHQSKRHRGEAVLATWKVMFKKDLEMRKLNVRNVKKINKQTNKQKKSIA